MHVQCICNYGAFSVYGQSKCKHALKQRRLDISVKLFCLVTICRTRQPAGHPSRVMRSAAAQRCTEGPVQCM